MRVALVLIVLLLAGCTGTTPEAAPAAEPRFSSPDDPIPEEHGGHDHRDPLQHLFARNATLLDGDDLRRFNWSQEMPVGAHALDIHGDLLAVAVNGGEGAEGQQGVHLFDISDPANLTHLSFWDAQVSVNGDRTIAFSGDGNTLFLGFEGAGVKPGVQALDISDPSKPVPVAFWDDPQNFGSHTIAAGVIDGTQYVFSLAVGVNILRYDASGFTLVGKYVTADELAAADAYKYLIGEEPGNPQTYAVRAVYGHDMNFYLDPQTNTPLLLVAYAYDGAKILDISVPSAPVLLGRFMPPADSNHKHYTHSITAERYAGRLIVVVGSETFEPSNQAIASPIWILDATDVLTTPPMTAQPEHVGTWRNPGGAAAGNLGLSVHFFRQEAGFVYISHYHGGIWAVDLRTPEARMVPQAFGYIMPLPEGAITPPEDCCIGYDLDGAPMVFDVAVKDGVVYGADIIQGVTSSRFMLPA